MNVVPAHINDRSAFGKVVIEKVRAISLHASNTNMKEMRTLNISSVNRVRYLTQLEKLVMLETNKINEVQIPVQAYKGKKGKLSSLLNVARVATKARTGPVEPIIVMGCADPKAYNMPQAAVDEIISTEPMAFPVAIPNNAPKPTAGAKQAKKRNNVAARH